VPGISIERPIGQALAILIHDQHTWLVVRDGNDHGREIDDGLFGTRVHGLTPIMLFASI